MTVHTPDRQRRRLVAGLWSSGLVGVLAGCATRGVVTTPAGAVTSGRLAVQVAGDTQRSFSAHFELSGTAERGLLLLTTPIGTRVAEARWQPGQARLETADGARDFDDLDSLARAVFREDIPLAALVDWLAGRPWSGAEARGLTGSAGFEQLGWRVQLDRHAEGLIVATRAAAPSLTVRARLDPV